MHINGCYLIEKEKEKQEIKQSSCDQRDRIRNERRRSSKRCERGRRGLGGGSRKVMVIETGQEGGGED